MLKYCAMLAMAMLFFTARGQNLDQIGVKQGIKVSGGINASGTFYSSSDTVKRRSPFTSIISGNFNLSLYGYSMPFTFTYSSMNKGYTQPFNRFAFTPQYKWVKAYVGYSSMTFSDYTLAGHTFFGGGLELTPGNWNVGLMYGRLRKAVQYNADSRVTPSFTRMGYGVKVGYHKETDGVDICVFSAKDDVGSVQQLPPDGSLAPLQNLAISVTAKKQLFKHWLIDAEYAVSALDGNITQKEGSTASPQGSNLAGTFLKATANTRYFDAFNGGAGYQATRWGLMLRYERIAPDYQTLGSYYCNNDMQNFTLAPNVNMLDGRLSASANVGLQTDNLDHSKASTSKRMVGSCNINFIPSEKWVTSVAYSNFTGYTKVRPQVDPNYQSETDSLDFYQINNNLNGTVGYSFGEKEAPQSVMLNLSYQKASDHSNREGGSNTSNFISANASYTYAIAKAGFSVTPSANFNRNDASGIESIFVGPALSIGKTLLKNKLRLSLSEGYSATLINSSNAGSILNSGLSCAYSPASNAKGKQSLSLGVNLQNRFKGAAGGRNLSELTTILTYSYRF